MGQLQCQMEDQAMHQLLSTLAEQTNIAFEEESGRVWEALQTHNHDVLLEAGSSLGGIKVNTMTKPPTTDSVDANQCSSPAENYVEHEVTCAWSQQPAGTWPHQQPAGSADSNYQTKFFS